MSGDPGLCGPHESFLLDGSERLEGTLHAVFLAGLHFHEHDGAALLGHDVKLKMAAAPVAVKDGPAHALQQCGRRILAFRAGTGPAGRRRLL